MVWNKKFFVETKAIYHHCIIEAIFTYRVDLCRTAQAEGKSVFSYSMTMSSLGCAKLIGFHDTPGQRPISERRIIERRIIKNRISKVKSLNIRNQEYMQSPIIIKLGVVVTCGNKKNIIAKENCYV
jgi:hypothetical protein